MSTIPEPPAVHVEYVAPASCPPVASFVAGLSARGVRVSDADGVRRLSANIRGNASDGYVGTVFVGPGGAERHVQGRVCSEIVSALAFVAALEVEAIERQAQTDAPPKDAPPKDAPPKDAPPKDAPPKDAPPKDTPPKDAPQKDAPQKDAPQKDAPQKDAVARSDDLGAREDVSVLASLDFGADAAVVAGPLPAATFALPLFVEAGFTAPQAFPLHLRLRFQQVGEETSGPTYGAQFTLTTGSIELAGTAWEHGRLRAFAGVRVDAGTLAASGSQITPARESSRPWVTIGPDVRGRLVIAGPFFAELDIGVPVTLTRDRFFVEPDTTVHRPGAVGLAAGLGLGFSLF